MNPPIYYLDTSALIKRYVAETGSAWIRTLADPHGAQSAADRPTDCRRGSQRLGPS